MDAGTILSGYGLAGLVIAALSTVVVFQEKEKASLRKELREQYEIRVNEAQDTRNKLLEPMENVIENSKKTYELLVSVSTGKRRL